MEIVNKPTAALRGYDRNARTHSAAQVDQIAASIQEFGFNNPILIDESDTVIAGHGRLAAAIKIGTASVPCVVLAHLSDAQRRAYILADNKIALNSGWDDKLLALELADLQSMDINFQLIGFSEKELLELLPVNPVEGLTDPDDVPELPTDPITKYGDVWILGNHRLMCGDSTLGDHWQVLAGGGVSAVGLDRSSVQCQLWGQGVRPEQGPKRPPQLRQNYER